MTNPAHTAKNKDDKMSKYIDHTENYRKRYKELGIVQFNAFVPLEHKNRLLEECKKLRVEYLEKAGYYAERDEKK